MMMMMMMMMMMKFLTLLLCNAAVRSYVTIRRQCLLTSNRQKVFVQKYVSPGVL
jgi:hypothetical protein